MLSLKGNVGIILVKTDYYIKKYASYIIFIIYKIDYLDKKNYKIYKLLGN